MLTLAHVSKSFGANRALDDVSPSVAEGEIVGLVGENGAGKTTLMRIVAGEIPRDAGTIELGCAPREVSFVHQHFMLVNELTVAENLALALGTRQREPALAAIERAGMAAPLAMDRRVADLSVGEKAKLELVKALAPRPKLLILDEPTSVLTPAEAEELFAVVRRLAANGTGVVFISHKVPEVLALAHRVVVLRRGRLVAEGRDMSAQQLAEAMVGTLPPSAPPPARTPGAVKLDLDGMTVRGGEIVAVIGVAGNGQAELAATLRARHLERTIAFIPEDRTRDGVVGEMSIAENIALSSRRWRRSDAERRAAQLIALYSIRAQSPRQRAESLSGGNQQKMILARELDRRPEIVVAAEPTRGLDLEATAFVHEQLRTAAGAGAAILLITSDLDEAFALADTIYVIYRGRLSERLTPGEARKHAAALMAGVA
jgi:simple sugar transport system ATP-binding protein